MFLQALCFKYCWRGSDSPVICHPAHPAPSLVRKVEVARQVFSVRLTAAVSSLSNRRTSMSLNVPERLTFANSLTMCHPQNILYHNPVYKYILCLCMKHMSHKTVLSLSMSSRFYRFSSVPYLKRMVIILKTG